MKNYRRLMGVSFLIFVLFINPVISAAVPSHKPTKIGSSLAFELSKQSRDQKVMAKTLKTTAEHSTSHEMKVSVRFDHILSTSEIEALQETDVTFIYLNEEVAHVGTVFGVTLPADRVNQLAMRNDVLRIETVQVPNVVMPLNVSIPMIGADSVWQMKDNQGRRVTGRGVTVANFDTGVDIFHPAFFNPDGGRYAWIDNNGNGIFDPGRDCVDLNRNNLCNAGESLEVLDATWMGTSDNGWGDGVCDASLDWLYADTNGNGRRDFGPPDFNEYDPTYGETIFIIDDTNGNGLLDVGEELLALGTSKVYKTLNSDGVERIRGTDLILSATDVIGHGTGVAGILGGGTAGRGRLFNGVAPDIDLLVADCYSNDYTVYMPWAQANGAKVMNYEYCVWTGQFLDGSSNHEAMIDTLAAQGIVQIAAAGNLGASDKHFHASLPTSPNGRTIRFDVPSDMEIEEVLITILWRQPASDLSFEITTPQEHGSQTIHLRGDSEWIIIDDMFRLWSRRENSLRGTAKFDIRLLKWLDGDYYPIESGQWTLKIINANDRLDVDGYIADNVSSWTGGAIFLDDVDTLRTTTWPATADSIITVANFYPRDMDETIQAQELSPSSGRGPRIDGAPITDIAAPGSWCVSPRSKDQGDEKAEGLASYGAFGGTSAAAPHVAGGAALLLQLHPTIGHAEIKHAIQQGARSDDFTGSVPNDLWGYGKLDLPMAAQHVRVLYVDDDAPNDPGPNDSSMSDSLEDGSPEHPFDSIQEAIDTALPGWEVVILRGRYDGNDNRDLDFGGKRLTLRSEDPGNPDIVEDTVIDCDGDSSIGREHRAFHFTSGETILSILNGITIQNGYQYIGGGIFCENGSNPTIMNCIFRENRGVYGGGIGNDNSNPIVANCTFIDNRVGDKGAGIFCKQQSNACIVNCLFVGNYAKWEGGAIYNKDRSNPRIINCTFSKNSADYAGGAISSEYDTCTPNIDNCILWDNSAQSVTVRQAQIFGGISDINFCCIQGWTDGGLGVINSDPFFVNPNDNNYKLLSNSPCINNGSKEALPNDSWDLDKDGNIDESIPFDLDGNPRIIDSNVDMGVYEYHG